MRDDSTTGGRTKLSAAIEAANAFVGTLALPVDQAAVVGFNSEAWIEQPLTGDRANPEPASTAVRRAQAAKDDHITIFTIGLGEDDQLNVIELAQMASRPKYFFRAPDGEDLLAIYRTIAVEIPCPAEMWWGGR